ncbi:hypothetical protein [Streptomyces sp. NPDC017993]|uniref:hypothetical protein n=1 Tax=Streptomyces sp. NPDC017993 TaxID=3365027 RepID=UPI0037A5BDDF
MTSMQDPPEPTPRASDARAAASFEDRAVRMRRHLDRLIGLAAAEGNALLPPRNEDENFAAMPDGIRSAQHTVDVMTRLDRRSFDHVEEGMLAILDEQFTAAALLDGHSNDDLTVSTPIRDGRWRRRSVVQSVQEVAVLPISLSVTLSVLPPPGPTL